MMNSLQPLRRIADHARTKTPLVVPQRGDLTRCYGMLGLVAFNYELLIFNPADYEHNLQTSIKCLETDLRTVHATGPIR
jgi:hypothetical protein